MIGYLVFENKGHLIMVEECNVSAPIYGGHRVKTITKVAKVTIPIRFTYSTSTLSSEQFKQIMSYSWEESHFFCDSADLSSTFPYREANDKFACRLT